MHLLSTIVETLMKHQMAPMLEDRVNFEHPSFHATGIEFFGLMNVRINQSSVKRWGVIFACMSWRVVHLELSHSLKNDSFLAVFFSNLHPAEEHRAQYTLTPERYKPHICKKRASRFDQTA